MMHMKQGSVSAISEKTKTDSSSLPLDSIRGDREFAKLLQSNMQKLEFCIDCPSTRMILKNAISALLELDLKFEEPEILCFLRDRDFREAILNEIKNETPSYAGEEWRASWKKEHAPLYSSAHQRILRRQGTLSFWNSEWNLIPEESRVHVCNILEKR